VADAPEHVCAEDCEHFLPKDGHWHLQKGIPVAVISSLFLMAIAVGGWIWMLSAQASALNDNVLRVSTLEHRLDASNADERDVIARLARIEGKLEVMLNRVGGK
jgi:hypothetical protein